MELRLLWGFKNDRQPYKKIRHKLGKKGKYIQTIRGIGYKFEVK